jgi:chemosensory pili system protein ChpA (sensor histidine kinase/response regulator)
MSDRPLVMVVDDDFDSLEIIRQILVAGGYRVEVFSDPMDALERMREQKPDLVVTDLMMKTIDSGLSFSRLLNYDPRWQGIPIVLVTSAVKKRGLMIQVRSENALEQMGIDAYFDKPVNPQALLAKVAELLAARKE